MKRPTTAGFDETSTAACTTLEPAEVISEAAEVISKSAEMTYEAAEVM